MKITKDMIGQVVTRTGHATLSNKSGGTYIDNSFIGDKVLVLGLDDDGMQYKWLEYHEDHEGTLSHEWLDDKWKFYEADSMVAFRYASAGIGKSHRANDKVLLAIDDLELAAEKLQVEKLKNIVHIQSVALNAIKSGLHMTGGGACKQCRLEHKQEGGGPYCPGCELPFDEFDVIDTCEQEIAKLESESAN